VSLLKTIKFYFVVSIQLDSIWYLFRKQFFGLNNPAVRAFFKFIKWPCCDLIHHVKTFIDPCFPRWRKTAPRHIYTDGTHLIVESNLAFILDFYYEEIVTGHADWFGDNVYKKFYEELIANVNWIENERKEIEKLSTEALTKVLKSSIFSDNSIDYNKAYADHNRLEQHKQQKETEILKWVVDNRDFFCT